MAGAGLAGLLGAIAQNVEAQRQANAAAAEQQRAMLEAAPVALPHYAAAFAAEGALIGLTVRIRLPNDRVVRRPDPWPVRVDDADARAISLLKSHLTPAQLDQYEKTRTFSVTGSAGGTYRIDHGDVFNILRLENGVEMERICTVPEGHLCVGDVLLAQKISLETDEPAALKVANHRWVGPAAARPAGDPSRTMQEIYNRIASLAVDQIMRANDRGGLGDLIRQIYPPERLRAAVAPEPAPPPAPEPPPPNHLRYRRGPPQRPRRGASRLLNWGR